MHAVPTNPKPTCRVKIPSLHQLLLIAIVITSIVSISLWQRSSMMIWTTQQREYEYILDDDSMPQKELRTDNHVDNGNIKMNDDSIPAKIPPPTPTTTCADSPLRMVSDSDEFRPGCDWVRRKPRLRCTRPGVAEHCPETCKTCVTCKDSPNGFYLPSGKRRTCEFVARKKHERCKKPEYRDSCRLTCGVCDGNQRKPNIMIIFADDVGTGDIPFYWNTNTSKVDMPNIQALASKSVIFTDVHSTPLCAPSRYMLLSGNYAHRGRLRGGTWNINGQHNQFRSHESSVAKPFQNDGYHTTMFGKWHLGGKVPPNGSNSSKAEILSCNQHNWNEPLIDGPQTIGFDKSRITVDGIQGAPYSFFRNGYLETTKNDIKLWEVGEYPMPQGTSIIREGFPGEGDISWDSTAYNMILVNETNDFLDDHLKNRKDDPFFAHIALGATHIPHSPPNFYLDGTPVNGTYATRHMDMLHELDKAVGSLVSAIEDRNLADNTIIIFTSDNGGIGSVHGSFAYGHYPSGPLRGAKGQIYEGGHRVPMMVRYDNHFPVNERRDHLVGLHDIYATLCELAGLTVPYGSAYDSISFADYLYSKDATANLRDSLGTWKQHVAAAVRFREMKYIEIYGKKTNNTSIVARLYNLTSDISEKVDLLTSGNTYYDDIKKIMKRKLDELSRNGPDTGNKFSISTGSGFQDEALRDCEFFKKDQKRCNIYWEGLSHCRMTCHPDHY